MDPMILALGLFALMYALLLILADKRWIVALCAAAVFIILGILPAGSALGAINWNVLMMLSGTMVIVELFIQSQMPILMAEKLLQITPNVQWAVVVLSLFSGLISAFVDNVATVLMVAPVGIAVCRKLKISPIPMILSIAVSSNLQGAATLVGDTTSIMLGAYAKMDFLAFFWMEGKPGIFFAVELGALATVPVMMILFRGFRQTVKAESRTRVEDKFPTIMLILVVLLLIGASFIPGKPETTNGMICCAIAAVTAVYEAWKSRGSGSTMHALKSVDYETLILLLGLFLVIQGITEAGVIHDVAGAIASVGGRNMFLLYTIIVWGSVAASAFIDNIPYVATMLPVIRGITGALGVEPYLLYFGLLTGATLGGNLTPIGASANITATGLLKKEGYEISFADFAKIGIPFTLIAVLTGYLFIWFVWS